MSPVSQAKRKKLAQYERTSNIRKLKKYEDNEVTLDDEQNGTDTDRRLGSTVQGGG